MCTLASGVRLSVQLSRAEEADFSARLALDWETAQAALSNVDVRHAEAFDAEDQRRIRASPRSADLGFRAPNVLVSHRASRPRATILSAQSNETAGLSISASASLSACANILALKASTAKIARYAVSSDNSGVLTANRG